MTWEVEFTDEFETIWDEMDEDLQEEVDTVIQVLEEKGPDLRRPHSGAIKI